MIHDDVVVVEPDSLPYGGTHRGRQAFLDDVLSEILKRADLQIEEAEATDAGDVVLARMVLRLTHRETGRVLHLPLVELYTIDDGTVRRIEVYPRDTVPYADFMLRG